MARRKIKKTYKERQREIAETPEYVEEKLWNLSDWMEENWRPVVGGLGALVLIWGGIGVYQQLASSSSDAAAAATAPVFEALSRPVYVTPEGVTGEDPNRPRGPIFGSEAARADAVLAATKGADDGAAALLAGAAKGRKGDWAGQLAGVDAALGKFSDPSIKAALQQQRAAALTGLGKKAEAAKAWGDVAASAKSNVNKAIAHVNVGDLHHPANGGGDATKAKAAYAAAMKALGGKDGKAPKDGVPAFIYADAKLKSAQL